MSSQVAIRATTQDHEVEVLPCERDAKDVFFFSKERSENRIDQRMPLEFVTNSFLPSKASAR
ncbi:MAG: hypothetical protein B6D38_00110 [Anaerolineae bacterium UTCFX1]|nr:MAG: hypothetical protein B6D38_00110 [Anaerolineae bacterium UTCFX1]